MHPPGAAVHFRAEPGCCQRCASHGCGVMNDEHLCACSWAEIRVPRWSVALELSIQKGRGGKLPQLFCTNVQINGEYLLQQ